MTVFTAQGAVTILASVLPPVIAVKKVIGQFEILLIYWPRLSKAPVINRNNVQDAKKFVKMS